jgi:diguanylate cyclase (GGDEF)-like protein
VSEGDSVKKAKKELGGVGSGDSSDASRVGPGAASRGGSGDRSGGTESVESMLQEFSAGGTGAPGPGAAPRGKYDQLWQLSMADPHTGLANQLLLLDRLGQALTRRRRHGGDVLVCHIGLDNLGEINMDLGYSTGNAVISEVARRLTSVVRAEDTIGRVGGSELVVVLTVTDEHVVGPFMRRLQHTLDEPVTVGGQPISLHASLGVAIAEEGESAEAVLSRADKSTRVGRR